MNHGQIPGFIIYKAYTRKDIEKESLNVKEMYLVTFIIQLNF